MKLSETITQIRDQKLKTVTLDRQILDLENEKTKLLKTKEAVKRGYAMAIYSESSGLYKNEKLREFTLKNMVSKDETNQGLNVEIALLEDKINKLTFEKADLGIEVDYLKNTLRLAEIDLAILKK